MTALTTRWPSPGLARKTQQKVQKTKIALRATCWPDTTTTRRLLDGQLPEPSLLI